MAPLRWGSLSFCATNSDGLYILILSNTSTFFHRILNFYFSFLLDPLFLTDFAGNSCSPRLSFSLPHILYSTGSALYGGLQEVAHWGTEPRQSSAKLSSRYGLPNLRSI